MPIKRLTVALLALSLLGATKAKKADTPPAKVPDKLRPYVELSRLCAEYEKQVTVVQWRETWRQNFDAATAEKWVTPPAPADQPNQAVIGPQPMRSTPIVTSERVDGRDCAVLDAVDIQNAYLPIGSGPIRGEFAIEFVAKAMSDRPCDLSIACMAPGQQQGPSFEFGAHWNQANFIRANVDGQIQRISAPREPLIEVNRWYTVRLEVRNGKTTGLIDGKEIKSVDSRTDADRAYTPNIYLYQSKIAVDEVHIEAMAPSTATIDAATAFAKVFGDRPREKVMADIRQLVDALDDGDYRVREAAQALLKPMGTLTREALQAAIDAGSAEQMSRAQQLMDLLPPPTTKPSN